MEDVVASDEVVVVLAPPPSVAKYAAVPAANTKTTTTTAANALEMPTPEPRLVSLILLEHMDLGSRTGGFILNHVCIMVDFRTSFAYRRARMAYWLRKNSMKRQSGYGGL